MRLGQVGVGLLLCTLGAGAVTLAHFANTGIRAMQVDSEGNIYIAGFQGTAGSPATYDAFVARLTPDGSKVLYSTKFAGSQSDFASVLALDSTGSAYIAGLTQSPGLSGNAGRAPRQRCRPDRAGDLWRG